MFDQVNLCGPRVFKSPKKEELRLCQHFHAYNHMFESFHRMVKDILYKDALKPKRHHRKHHRKHHHHGKQVQPSVFLEQLQRRKDSLRANQPRHNSRILKPQQSKVAKRSPRCPHIDRSLNMRSKEKLEEMKRLYCTEYNLDLSDEEIVNIAMVSVDGDIDRKPAFKEALSSAARFRVRDQCTDPLLHGTDVSLQKVGDGKWSLVMQLDARSGYLQHEISESLQLWRLHASDRSRDSSVHGRAAMLQTNKGFRRLCQIRLPTEGGESCMGGSTTVV